MRLTRSKELKTTHDHQLVEKKNLSAKTSCDRTLSQPTNAWANCETKKQNAEKYTPGMPRTTDDIIHCDSIPVLADRLIVEVTGRWYQTRCRLLRIFLQNILRSQWVTSQGFRDRERVRVSSRGISWLPRKHGCGKSRLSRAECRQISAPSL